MDDYRPSGIAVYLVGCEWWNDVYADMFGSQYVKMDDGDFVPLQDVRITAISKMMPCEW